MPCPPGKSHHGLRQWCFKYSMAICPQSMDICSCLLHLNSDHAVTISKMVPKGNLHGTGSRPKVPTSTKRLQKLWPSSRVWFTIVVARGQTIRFHPSRSHGSEPKFRTLGQFQSFFSSLMSHKVILGAPPVSESSNSSMAALPTFCAKRCYQNVPCPSELV